MFSEEQKTCRNLGEQYGFMEELEREPGGGIRRIWAQARVRAGEFLVFSFVWAHRMDSMDIMDAMDTVDKQESIAGRRDEASGSVGYFQCGVRIAEFLRTIRTRWTGWTAY